jgi:hypothetical protein
MTVNVKVIYAADRSSSQFFGLSTATQISYIKELIAYENSLDSTDSIRVVQRGRILSNSASLSSLFISAQLIIVVFATGIPSKSRFAPPALPSDLRPVFEEFLVHEPMEEDQPDEAPPQRNRKELFAGIFGLIAFFGVVIYLAIPKTASHVENPPLVVWDRITVFSTISMCVFALIFWLSWGHIEPTFFWQCVRVFFESMLPTFHLDAFRAAHQ